MVQSFYSNFLLSLCLRICVHVCVCLSTWLYMHVGVRWSRLWAWKFLTAFPMYFFSLCDCLWGCLCYCLWWLICPLSLCMCVCVCLWSLWCIPCPFLPTPCAISRQHFIRPERPDHVPRPAGSVSPWRISRFSQQHSAPAPQTFSLQWQLVFSLYQRGGTLCAEPLCSHPR